MCANNHRPGMRHRHGRGVQTNGLRHPKPLNKISNRLAKRFPPQIRLRPGKQQKRFIVRVEDHLNTQVNLLHIGHRIMINSGHGPARPVVNKLIIIKRRHRPMIESGKQIRGALIHRMSRIGIAL